MSTRDLNESEIEKAEAQATHAEAELGALISEAEDDAKEVAATLSELRLRLEEVVRGGGATGLDEVLDEARHVAAPVVPLDRHRSRVLEARADAMRARLWVVSAMKDDLKRFSLELADAVRTAETVRVALDRHAEAPRLSVTRRFERIRAVTADLTSRVESIESHPRRLLPRVRLETAIDMHSTSNFFNGFSENISDGGVFVATDLDLPGDTEVELAFTLPDGVEIRGRGKVRWVRKAGPDVPGGVGVQFLNLSGAARDAVQNFLAMREPLFHVDE